MIGGGHFEAGTAGVSQGVLLHKGSQVNKTCSKQRQNSSIILSITHSIMDI